MSHMIPKTVATGRRGARTRWSTFTASDCDVDAVPLLVETKDRLTLAALDLFTIRLNAACARAVAMLRSKRMVKGTKGAKPRA